MVFDNISNYEHAVPGARIASTASTPNRFMGDAYTLANGTAFITGFDLFPVNLTGTAFTGLKFNVYVWGNVNSGTVNALNPAFSDLLGTYTFTKSSAFPSGFYYAQEGSPIGSTPGYTLPTPLAIPSTTVGLSFNYQGTTDGTTFNSLNSLTSLISYGTPPTVGSQLFNGYFRNVNSEADGNFTSTLRSLGYQDQSVALRVYGNAAETAVPEPSGVFAGLFVTGMLVFRCRRQRPSAA